MLYSSMTLDPYVELGVRRDATQQSIKQAYRRVALETHPDRNADDAAAVERFRRATQAYSLLRDPERRLRFDRTGRWEDVRLPGELDVELAEALEIFARDFGAAVDVLAMEDWAPAHTGRVTMTVDVTYEEVESGARRRIPKPCAHCAGSGAREGSTQVRCTSCGGSGRLRHVEHSLLGPRIHTERCESCHGSGRRPLLACPGCDGSGRAPGAETIEVLIPRGTADGDLLDSLTANGSRFVARLVEDRRWARDGADLYATGRIPYDLAVLGGTIDVELPGRSHRVAVPAGTASGHRMSITEQGLPRRDGSGRGDLVLTLHVAVPEQVGTLERWLMRARRGRASAAAEPGLVARVSRLQARARAIAGEQWRQWRLHHHRSSLLRIERAAATLRSSAGLLSDSEQRLGPLLERGFPMIAPEAAVARTRLEGGRVRYAALAEFAVDSVLVAILGTGLWLLAEFAAPAVAAAGETPWWDLMRKVHPVLFALVPLTAGLGAGALRNVTQKKSLQRLVALPLGVAVGGAAAATGAAMFATAARMSPESDFVLIVALSLMAAFAIGVVPIFLFLLGDSLVDSARLAAEEANDRADRRMLRKYDVAAARLATHLVATERAFRQLLTQAEDARRPLTSLLNSAADTLAADRHRRPRSAGFQAAAAMLAHIGVTLVWAAATILAVVVAFTLFPDDAGMRFGAALVVAALCGTGCLMPQAFVERLRSSDLTAALATAVAVFALAGIFAIGPTAGAGWLAAGAAIAAVALSFRLRESVRATTVAATLAGAGGVALLLWPIALAYAVARGKHPAMTEGSNGTPTRT